MQPVNDIVVEVDVVDLAEVFVIVVVALDDDDWMDEPSLAVIAEPRCTTALSSKLPIRLAFDGPHAVNINLNPGSSIELRPISVALRGPPPSNVPYSPGASVMIWSVGLRFASNTLVVGHQAGSASDHLAP